MSAARSSLLLLLLLFLLSAMTSESRDNMASIRVDRASVKHKKQRLELCAAHGTCESNSLTNRTLDRNCFCDLLCVDYNDCCRDYNTSSLSTTSTTKTTSSSSLQRLRANEFTCQTVFGNYMYPVYMINDCPVDVDNTKCQGGPTTAGSSSLADIIYSVPVSSSSSKRLYRNIFCAMCHSEKTESLVYWTANCQAAQNISTSIERCQWVFNPSDRLPAPRRCTKGVINRCPVDWSNQDTAWNCQYGPALLVYKSVPYRNRYCAVCHNVSESDLECESSGNRAKVLAEQFASFSIMFDFNTASGVAVDGGESQQFDECPVGEMFDPFKEQCRQMPCLPRSPCHIQLSRKNAVLSRSGSQLVRMSLIDSPSTSSNCDVIRLDPTEYELFENGTAFVALYGLAYNEGEYERDENQSLYICAPFNSTNTIHAALSVDVIGTYLSVICSVLSLMALLCQFIVYMWFPVLRNTPGKCVICLVVCLFVGQFLFLLVAVGKHLGFSACFVQSTLMHYSYIAAFFWMNVMAIDIFRTFGSSTSAKSSSSSSRRFTMYSIYCWTSAGVLVAVSILVDLLQVGHSYRPHYGVDLCWFGSRDGLLVYFVIPICLLLVANVVLFAASVRQIQNASKASQMAVQKSANSQLVVIYVKLSVVMGLGWLIGFLAAVSGWSWLWYIFILINCLQGTFICAAFIVTRQVVRLLRERFRSMRISTQNLQPPTPSTQPTSSQTKFTTIQ